MENKLNYLIAERINQNDLFYSEYELKELQTITDAFGEAGLDDSLSDKMAELVFTYKKEYPNSTLCRSTMEDVRILDGKNGYLNGKDDLVITNFNGNVLQTYEGKVARDISACRNVNILQAEQYLNQRINDLKKNIEIEKIEYLAPFITERDPNIFLAKRGPVVKVFDLHKLGFGKEVKRDISTYNEIKNNLLSSGKDIKEYEYFGMHNAITNSSILHNSIFNNFSSKEIQSIVRVANARNREILDMCKAEFNHLNISAKKKTFDKYKRDASIVENKPKEQKAMNTFFRKGGDLSR